MKMIIIAAALVLTAFNAQAQRTKSKPNYSFASTTEHEFVISPSQVSIESYEDTENRTAITIYGGYNYHLNEDMQVGGEGGLVSLPNNKGDLETHIALMGVFTYNFDQNLRDAFFVQGGLGLYPSFNDDRDKREYEDKISLFAGAGKRFEMWGKINYMPYARIWKRGDESVRIELQALNFSIFF